MFLRIRYERLRLGLTQGELGRAARPEVTQGDVSDIELGKRPQPGQLQALAQVLGIDAASANILQEPVPSTLSPEVPDPPDMIALIKARRAR